MLPWLRSVAARLCLALLVLLLGLIAPVHAGPPLIVPAVTAQAPDGQPDRVIAVYLRANRAHGPPSGAVLVVPACAARGSAGASFVLNGSQVIQERDLPQVLSAADIASDGTLPATDAPAPEGSILDAPGTWHLNCQPAATPIPEGWLSDKGRALEARTNGLTYGWERAAVPQALMSGNSLRRNAMPQPELDTLHRLTEDDATATWRCALPDGHYAVVIVAGDPSSRVHTNHLTLNGQTLTDPDPYDPAVNTGYILGDYDGWAVDVEVTDGFLTLAAGTGALDPALCLIEVGLLGSAVDDALRDKLAGVIERASQRTAGNPNLYPPTPRTYAYGGDYVDAPLAMKAGVGAAAATYFIHANALYSPQAVTDQNGCLATIRLAGRRQLDWPVSAPVV